MSFIYRLSLSQRIAIGALLSVLLIVIFLGVGLSLNQLNYNDPDALTSIRLSLAHCILVGYSLFALMQLYTSKAKTHTVIRPMLDSNADKVKDWADSQIFWVLGGISALLTAFSAPYLTTQQPWHINHLSYTTSWDRILGLIISFQLTLFVLSMIGHSLYLARLTNYYKKFDLLNFDNFDPLVNQGKQNALLSVGAATVAALFIVDNSQIITAVFMGVTMLLAMIAGLLLPLTGAHRLIKQHKDHEQQLISTQLQQLSHYPEDQMSLLLKKSQLVSYRRHIQLISEWPITTGTWLRVATFVAAPLGSWASGQLLQKLIAANF